MSTTVNFERALNVAGETSSESSSNIGSSQTVDKLFEEIKNLRSFVYTFRDKIMMVIRNLFCKKRRTSRDMLYKRAVKRIEQQFDIIRLFK